MFFVCNSYVPSYMIVMINGVKVNSVEVSFLTKEAPHCNLEISVMFGMTGTWL